MINAWLGMEKFSELPRRYFPCLADQACVLQYAQKMSSKHGRRFKKNFGSCYELDIGFNMLLTHIENKMCGINEMGVISGFNKNVFPVFSLMGEGKGKQSNFKKRRAVGDVEN